MKKFFFFAAALIGLLAVSCNKEKEAPVSIDPVKGATHTVSFKATIAPETRTSYADDKTFSWVKNDSIIVVTLSPDEKYIRLSTFYAQSSGAETIFTGEVEDGYTLYSLAFYTSAGASVAFGEDDDNNIYFYLPSFINIDGDPETDYTAESANPLANLPLMGVQQEDDSYLFYTATGAAKFTFTDVPEGAAYFVVEMSDEPLSGYFTWDETGIITNATARPGYRTYTDSDGQTHKISYSNHYVVYHFDRNADGTGTIYMPLPVGRIPAGSTVSFYDEDLEKALYTRTLRDDVPIERNRVTEIATFSATSEWESMGVGAVYDYPVFYYMTADEDKDNEDILYHMAQVEFFRDTKRPGVYRLENPYKQGAEDRNYVISSEFLEQMDDYLELTVLRDGTIIHNDYYTGYNYSNYHPFAGCPAMYGDENSFNFVAKVTEDGVPMNAFLSSLYLFEMNGGIYYWDWPDSWSYMWTMLLFPDAEKQLDLNCSIDFVEIADDDPLHPTGYVDLKLGGDLVGAYVVIAQDRETAEEMIAAGKGAYYDEDGKVIAPFPEDAPTGEYYAYAKTVPTDGLTANCALLFGSEDEYDYYRSDMDRQLTLDDVIGSYSTVGDYFTIKQYKRTGSGWSKNQTMTMTIEESDDPLSGDIMFTEIVPELAKAVSNRNAELVPVYGWFDTATGVISIDLDQKACTYRNDYYTIGDFYGKAVSLYLDESGAILCKKDIGYLPNGQMNEYGVPDGFTDEGLSYTRAGSAAAPAKAPARYHKATGSGAGHSAPSVVNPSIFKRHSDVEMLYPGQRVTLTK